MFPSFKEDDALFEESCDRDKVYGHLREINVEANALWIKAVERGLEAVLWRFYESRSSVPEKHIMYVADPAGAGLKGSEKCVTVNCPDMMELMYCGGVSTEPSAHSLPLGTLGDIQFFIHPTPAPPGGDAVVPAWLAKPTPKRENVTLEAAHSTISVYITSNGTVSTSSPVLEWEEKQAQTCLIQSLKKAEARAQKYKKLAKKWKEAIPAIQKEKDEKEEEQKEGQQQPNNMETKEKEHEPGAKSADGPQGEGELSETKPPKDADAAPDSVLSKGEGGGDTEALGLPDTVMDASSFQEKASESQVPDAAPGKDAPPKPQQPQMEQTAHKHQDNELDSAEEEPEESPFKKLRTCAGPKPLYMQMELHIHSLLGSV